MAVEEVEETCSEVGRLTAERGKEGRRSMFFLIKLWEMFMDLHLR